MNLNQTDCEELLDILMVSDIDNALKLRFRERFYYSEFKDNYYTNRDKWIDKLKKELDKLDV